MMTHKIQFSLLAIHKPLQTNLGRNALYETQLSLFILKDCPVKQRERKRKREREREGDYALTYICTCIQRDNMLLNIYYL